ncbi:MAG TPA: hypothetical protein VMZ90_14655 [Vicinamibacterales bacterium]|nr:hypothetical protein [Vicinamibacterales bacterium]
MRTIRVIAIVLVGAAGPVFAGQTQGASQGPKPFPTAATPQTPPQAPPTSESLGAMPVYPAAQFLETIDAGKGQQFHLYGTDAAFADLVAYYKTALKSSGRVLFQAPAMHQFDLGKYQEETMAYPPSVVIKDYTWNGSEGYLHVSGATSKRYKTIIQIVPATVK